MLSIFLKEFKFKLLVIFVCLGGINSQSQGSYNEEFHHPVPLSVCTKDGCQEEATSMVLSGDSHWLHQVGNQEDCLINGEWNSDVCPDALTCAQNCALDGIDEQTWSETFGITQWENGVRMNFLTEGPYGRTVGSGMYMMDSDDQNYKMFRLKNREFTFDVDASTIGCGINSAVYFVEMKEDGGLSSEEGNSVGARYGTGYCDAQCPSYMNWVGGLANSKNDDGFASNGACCFEMDIWEANSQANSFTIHNCNIEGSYICQDDCDRCDKIGCETNVYRLGNLDFYGNDTQFTVDSSKPITVITQFITSDGTDNGDLVEIKRKYRQDGKTFENPNAKLQGLESYSSESDDFCRDVEAVYGQHDYMAEMGGMKAMGKAFDRGLVLAVSLWEDHQNYMLWLDSVFPPGVDPNSPGATRGPCPTDSGRPEDLEVIFADSYVKFYNFKIGDIDTTY